MDSAEQKRTTEVPVVYKLIESKAPTEDIAAQIVRDAKPGNDAAEKMFLGFEELLRRGEEGKEVVRRLAAADDFSGATAKSLSEAGDPGPRSLESLIGIKRWGEFVTLDDDKKFVATLQARIDKMQYSRKSVEELFKEEFIEDEVLGLNPHLDEVLDHSVVNSASTFGSSEPVYLELLGPREILRLRSLREGRFLLLGSYGKYSAQDFANYAAKINPRIDTHVIDINYESIDAIDRSRTEGQTVAQADARRLPFASDSFDHVYTNNLFHFLRPTRVFKT